MDERDWSALTRRRLGGAVLLLVGIVVAVAVLLTAGNDKQAAKKASLPVRIVSVPPLGLGFAHPTSWKRKVSKQVIGLRSPDGSVLLFFSSPLAHPAVEEVRSQAKTELLQQFKPATIVNESRQPLGQRNVPSFELLGHDNGKVVRALEMVDSTDYRTYAVTVVTAEKPSRRRLREARQIIATVRFGKPKALGSKG